MRAFEFVKMFHDKYVDKAAKDPKICGAYTGLIKHYRDRLVIIGAAQCSKEEFEIVQMMVSECGILKEIAINNAISEKVSKE